MVKTGTNVTAEFDADSDTPKFVALYQYAYNGIPIIMDRSSTDIILKIPFLALTNGILTKLNYTTRISFILEPFIKSGSTKMMGYLYRVVCLGLKARLMVIASYV